MALSAFGSNDGSNSDYKEKFKNVEDLLTKKLGFFEFDKNEWFTKKPQSDSIGVVAAKKDLKSSKSGLDSDYTLIAVAVRGGGYESEWAGNFTLGETGQHYGFAKAKEQVLSFIKEYIAKKQITGKIKIWITGYSRAAATANMVAGEIDNGIYNGIKLGDNVTLSKSDLYAYCFETPMGVQKSEIKNKLKYNNIYNIINKNDPVTLVAMSALDFTRFGSEYFLPDKLTDGNEYSKKQEQMLYFYNKMASKKETGDYIVDDFQMKKVELKYILPGGNTFIQNEKGDSYQSSYLDDTVNKLTNEQIKTRANYVDNFQNGIRIICTTIYGTLFPDQPLERIYKFLDIFIDKLCNVNTLRELILTELNPFDSKSAEDIISEVMTAGLNEAGINNYNPSELKKFVSSVAGLAVKFLVSHPNLTVTGIMNARSLGSAHYPELCLAWLMSQDNNYSQDPQSFDGNGHYRIIRINCPIDVEVFDSNGNLQSVIKNDIPESITNNISCIINEDGEKVVYLPANASYKISMTSTGNGEMNFSINEFSSSAGNITRIINYQNIAISIGDTFNAVIPQYNQNLLSNETEGTDVKYTLYNAAGDVLKSDTDLVGDEAKQACYLVSLDSNNDEYGFVSGQGVRQKGNFAKIEAIPKNGYKFVGWYENDKLVATNAEYRFCVNRDIKLTAHFINDEITALTLDKTSLTLNRGEKYTLAVTVSPSDLTVSASDITWTSSNEAVATVSATGEVKGIKAGKATITATAENGVSATCEVTVRVVSKYYMVNVSSNYGGIVSPKRTHIVKAGNSDTIKISPYYGYKIDSVTVNDKAVPVINNTVTLKNIDENCSVYVKFVRADKFNVTVTANKGGYVSHIGTSEITSKGFMKIAVIPKIGYRIKSIKKDGISIRPSCCVFLTKINEDHTVDVEFEKISRLTKQDVDEAFRGMK